MLHPLVRAWHLLRHGTDDAVDPPKACSVATVEEFFAHVWPRACAFVQAHHPTRTLCFGAACKRAPALRNRTALQNDTAQWHVVQWPRGCDDAILAMWLHCALLSIGNRYAWSRRMVLVVTPTALECWMERPGYIMLLRRHAYRQCGLRGASVRREQAQLRVLDVPEPSTTKKKKKKKTQRVAEAPQPMPAQFRMVVKDAQGKPCVMLHDILMQTLMIIQLARRLLLPDYFLPIQLSDTAPPAPLIQAPGQLPRQHMPREVRIQYRDTPSYTWTDCLPPRRYAELPAEHPHRAQYEAMARMMWVMAQQREMSDIVAQTLIHALEYAHRLGLLVVVPTGDPGTSDELPCAVATRWRHVRLCMRYSRATQIVGLDPHGKRVHLRGDHDLDHFQSFVVIGGGDATNEVLVDASSAQMDAGQIKPITGTENMHEIVRAFRRHGVLPRHLTEEAVLRRMPDPTEAEQWFTSIYMANIFEMNASDRAAYHVSSWENTWTATPMARGKGDAVLFARRGQNAIPDTPSSPILLPRRDAPFPNGAARSRRTVQDVTPEDQFQEFLLMVQNVSTFAIGAIYQELVKRANV